MRHFFDDAEDGNGDDGDDGGDEDGDEDGDNGNEEDNAGGGGGGGDDDDHDNEDDDKRCVLGRTDGPAMDARSGEGRSVLHPSPDGRSGEVRSALRASLDRRSGKGCSALRCIPRRTDGPTTASPVAGPRVQPRACVLRPASTDPVSRPRNHSACSKETIFKHGPVP